MAFNRSPLRAITQEDVDTYNRDGVVCLRQVFDQDWIDLLRPLAADARMDRSKFSLLPTVGSARYMARTMPEFRTYAFESPLGEAVGKVLQSEKIRFFFDELFTKEPQSAQQTIWHNDRAGWPVVGKMVPSFWTALTPITKANSLECIAGSHNHDQLYWLFSPNARQMIRPEDRPIQPDGEALRGEEGIQFLSWDMEPSDALVIHPWTLHFSCGNSTDDWRFAISTRVFGDDIRWQPRPDCVSLDEMIPREPPQGALFPVIYNEKGPCDSGEDYPSSFATTWSAEAYERLALAARPKGGFQKLIKEEGGPTPLALKKLKADIRNGSHPRAFPRLNESKFCCRGLGGLIR